MGCAPAVDSLQSNAFYSNFFLIKESNQFKAPKFIIILYVVK